MPVASSAETAVPFKVLGPIRRPRRALPGRPAIFASGVLEDSQTLITLPSNQIVNTNSKQHLNFKIARC